jgi:multidrug efflux pump
VYPGANPKTISETVSVPLEQQLNGVENSLYTFSQATSDGVMTLTVTFKLGTDIDQAQQLVQNRVAQALPKLPEEVRRLGVLTLKSTPDLTMVVHLYSPDATYDDIFVRNYATLQVKDVLARIDGVGQVQLFGSGDYAMRVWLDPERLAARSMAPGDVVNAIREQNMQVAAGAVGQQPVQSPVAFELQINTRGRLVSVEEFGNIVVKRGVRGETLLLKDVARVELGAGEFALRSLLNNRSAVAIPIFQQPGSNALRLSQEVRSTMEMLKKNFPRGLEYAVAYDPTVFVKKSIDAVIHTLFEAILLVVLVVLVFLQTWRASIIPLAAVPVSLVGTFAVMSALGFSINALSLFGLVLAIGIVVDDAIVVVENVERNIALGLSPVDATRRAMDEVTGPIVATALVLCAVFIPTAFISGLSGMFYKQFAITIAISTVISAFNSLTLSPALSALLPEVLIGVGAARFAAIAERCLTPKTPPVVAVQHLHSSLVSVAEESKRVVEALRAGRTLSFRNLISDADSTLVVVARFLALLDLYRQGVLRFDQVMALGELQISWTGSDSGEIEATDEFDIPVISTEEDENV